MDLGSWHVGAAVGALLLGAGVLARRKGGTSHVVLGRCYLAAMLGVNVPVLFVYEDSGAPGPFHLLACISLTTTALGWVTVRRARRSGHRVTAHAALMTWSWIGVVTAGLAQLAHQQLPRQSPWPVVVVVAAATALGLVTVPRFVAREVHRRAASGRPGTRSA